MFVFFKPVLSNFFFSFLCCAEHIFAFPSRAQTVYAILFIYVIIHINVLWLLRWSRLGVKAR